jgi:hypothetical protein
MSFSRHLWTLQRFIVFFCYLTMLYECFKLKDYWNLSVPVSYDSPSYLLTWEFGTFYLLIVELRSYVFVTADEKDAKWITSR